MKYALVASTALSLIAFSGPLAADPPVVIELFTSQGCVSCPPADELMGELAGREDVIALALHVDYWDYIGWADTFAHSSFTARQYRYGEAAGSTVVYTPQMIIAGTDHVGGYQPDQVAEYIEAHRAQQQRVEVAAANNGGSWSVQANWLGEEAAPQMDVHLVAYMPMQEVQITRGENAGLMAEYHNIVTSWAVVSDWSGQSQFEMDLSPEGDGPFVLIIQAQGHGPIYGAVRLD